MAHEVPGVLARCLALGCLALSAAGCSPVYVIKAGLAEARILRARRPIPEVILDPATTEDTRAKLTLALEARTFALEVLRLDVGDAYTTYADLDRDTLAMVLSAAYRDRLEARTWWFPIVGRVPYRGFFDLEDALEEQRELEGDGFDTYLRPTSAFSTLGWFSDPILSTMVRSDDVGLVETVIHELAHRHLFVSGHVRFNESYATFVGGVGATHFFCTRDGGGPDTVKCERARKRWEDDLRFSRFLDGLVDDLQSIYQDPSLPSEEKIGRRAVVFQEYVRLFQDEVQPNLQASTFRVFTATPLNNATLMARMRYYHRLPDFQRFLEEHDGDLQRAIAALREGVNRVADPFDLLRPTS
jgi:predicted aminopeptidase